MDFAERALHGAKCGRGLAGIVEQRFAFGLAEPCVITIDGDLLARDEEPFPAQHERFESTALFQAWRKILAGLEAEHGAGEELAIVGVLGEQDRAARGSRGEFDPQYLQEMRRLQRDIAQSQARVLARIE